MEGLEVSLPSFNTTDRILQMLQSSWTSILNPFLARPQLNSSILNNIVLVSGTNVINTLLSRKLQGWSIVRQNASASIYDAQSNNPNPTQTLVLISSAPVTVDILVF